MSDSPLRDIIDLEKLDTNLFRGKNYMAPWGALFGGQVLAQALNAAGRTVPQERYLHSMHSYFILQGSLSKPIIYQVDPIRDGKSFNTRRVVAYQDGKAIFNLSSSFHKKEDGLSHQDPIPDVPSYEHFLSYEEILKEKGKDINPDLKALMSNRHIEFRPVENDLLKNINPDTVRHFWLKSKEPLGDSPSLHREVLAFGSDYNLMVTALIPHKKKIKKENLQMASLDHAMWFHCDFRADDWLLYQMESPCASNARGFSKGSFFTKQGNLVCTVVQEGLIRIKN